MLGKKALILALLLFIQIQNGKGIGKLCNQFDKHIEGDPLCLYSV